MKKFVSAVAALVLSACLATSAFAEATAGEAAQGAAIQVQQALVTITAEGKSEDSDEVRIAIGQTQQVVDALSNDHTATVTETQAQVGADMLKYLDAQDSNNIQTKSQADNGCSVEVTGYKDLSIAPQSVETSPEGNTVTINVSAGASALGYLVRVTVPGEMDGVYQSRYIGENGNTEQLSDASVQLSRANGFTTFEFWVPHFSTWQLYKVSDDAAVPPEESTPAVDTPAENTPAENTPAADNTTTANTTTNTAAANNTVAASTAAEDEWTYCPACGHNHWTATAEGYKCDNCGHIVTTVKSTSGVKGTYVPAATSENPIKKTGMDMDAGLFALIALAGAAVAGCAYGVKKFAMNK